MVHPGKTVRVWTSGRRPPVSGGWGGGGGNIMHCILRNGFVFLLVPATLEITLPAPLSPPPRGARLPALFALGFPPLLKPHFRNSRPELRSTFLEWKFTWWATLSPLSSNHSRYPLIFPCAIGCKDLALFILTVSFWSVGLWHKEIDSSPSPADESTTVSYKSNTFKIITGIDMDSYTLILVQLECCEF